MKLRLDLAAPRQAPALAGWLLLAVGLLLALWAGWRYTTVEAEYQHQQARLARFAAPVAKSKTPRHEQKEESPVLAKARSQLAADWPALLAGLERSRPANIAVLSISAEAGNGMLTLDGAAKDHAAMLAYLKRLAGEGGLSEIALTSHTDEELEGEKSVNFSLRARWRTP